MRFLFAVTAVLAMPGLSYAQAVCRPPESSNEANVFAEFSVPLAYGRMSAPVPRHAGEIQLGVEGTLLPNIDDRTSTPTICRPGKGPETTDFLFAFPRPRVGIGLPGAVFVEASWVPPVRVNGLKANLVSFAVGRAFTVSRSSVVIGVRAHGTVGRIRAPITCDDAALADPTSECFRGQKSDDRYDPNIFGFDAAISFPVKGGIRSYVGAGINLLRPRFQVNFTNQGGVHDNTRVEVNLERGVLFGGLTWQAGRALSISGELYAAPSDAVTGRFLVAYRVGRLTP